MSAVVIDGKAMAQEVRSEAAARAGALKSRFGVTPALAVILIGDDAASVSYVKGKRKALAEAGMADRSILLSGDTTEDELLSVIQGLNRDPLVHGILVQLPLPKHIDKDKVIFAIDPAKDVDGFHPLNCGNLFLGQSAPIPCTPHGIAVMLKKAGAATDGKRAVIMGRSDIVGKPLALLLMRRDVNCTVTVCHTGTRDLPEITREADILVAATGKPHSVTKDMVKEGACVIDVGVNRISDASKKSGYRLVGDVDFDEVKEVAGIITPVPGGVGPMTIAMLMLNTVEAAERAVGV